MGRTARGEGGTVAYVLAALGGALGALLRWAVAEALPVSAVGWPWATLLVNLSGCFLLGMLSAFLAGRSPEPSWARPFLGVGVLGGYTTYSTFAVEVVSRAEEGALLLAAGYLLLSVVGGLAAVLMGARTVARVRR
ncbi:MAG: crcB2 [Blastococcus sp.]|jgi:CrcB protein|nr:crcB2 [Blastococcus sp.]